MQCFDICVMVRVGTGEHRTGRGDGGQTRPLIGGEEANSAPDWLLIGGLIGV